MERQYWIDGFNFFHHWERTRGLYAKGADLAIARAIDISLRSLARELAGRARHTIVFMDGGWRWEERRLGHLRIRYAGPRGKADDRMAEELRDVDDAARSITAVTNDRELGSRLSYLGGKCLGVREYLALFDKKSDSRNSKTRRPRGEEAEVMRQKCQPLSPAEVLGWLEFFGCGDDEKWKGSTMALRKFQLETDREGFYDITGQIIGAIAESGVQDGVCVVYSPHTTAGITVNENTDPDVRHDLLLGLHDAFPDHQGFRHAEGNSAAHLKSTTVGASQTLIVNDGKPLLGIWQNIYFCEFDGPRQRHFFVKVM